MALGVNTTFAQGVAVKVHDWIGIDYDRESDGFITLYIKIGANIAHVGDTIYVSYRGNNSPFYRLVLESEDMRDYEGSTTIDLLFTDSETKDLTKRGIDYITIGKYDAYLGFFSRLKTKRNAKKALK